MGDERRSRLTRRGFLSGVTGLAGAAILAACGDEAAAPTATTAPIAATATRPAATMASAMATTAPATTAATTAPTAAATATMATTATTATSGATAAAMPIAASATSAMSAMAAGGPVTFLPLPDMARFRGQTLNMVSNQEYFMETQKTIDAELANFGKIIGATINNDHVNDNMGDVIAKFDAAVKANNSPDMIYFPKFVSQFAQLGHTIDVTDVVEELQRAYGPVEDGIRNDLVIDGKWRGIPYYSKANGWFARKDWMDEKGVKLENIKTWENLRDAALEISDPKANRFGWGMPVSQNGDANDLIINVMRSYGGAISSDDGKKVVFNSPETLAGVSFLADIYTNPKYRPMLHPGWPQWTDTGNNEAWLAGTLGFTLNAFTLYAKSFADKNPIYGKTAIFPGLTGPGTDRVINVPGWGAFMIFRTAKNPELAKATAKYLVAGMPHVNVAKTSLGLVLPAYKRLWNTDPFYTTGEPSFPALQRIIQAELPIKSKSGYSFPQSPSAGYDTVYTQYVLTDMMADIVQRNMKPAEAVKQAHDRMVKIFEQLGLKQ